MLFERKNKMAKEDEIKLIAYSIWESQGCSNRHEWEHWFIAQNIWDQKKKKIVEVNTKAEP
jgi:hypothetical protein